MWLGFVLLWVVAGLGFNGWCYSGLCGLLGRVCGWLGVFAWVFWIGGLGFGFGLFVVGCIAFVVLVA